MGGSRVGGGAGCAKPNASVVLPPPASWEVPPDVGVVSQVRAAVVRAAQDWGVPLDRDALADLKLCASEVITNAIVHTGSPCSVRAEWNGQQLRVEVADRSLRLPQQGNELNPETRGRGLALVGALASAMGWYPSGAGKVVWFELNATSALGPTDRFATLVRTAHQRANQHEPQPV